MIDAAQSRYSIRNPNADLTRFIASRLGHLVPAIVVVVLWLADRSFESLLVYLVTFLVVAAMWVLAGRLFAATWDPARNYVELVKEGLSLTLAGRRRLVIRYHDIESVDGAILRRDARGRSTSLYGGTVTVRLRTVSFKAFIYLNSPSKHLRLHTDDAEGLVARVRGQLAVR